MLDLDAIAARRAETLNQERKDWLDAVWSADFQWLSARVTDGEVVDLLGLCASAAELRSVASQLKSAPDDQTLTPVEWMKAQLDDGRLPIAEWIRGRSK